MGGIDEAALDCLSLVTEMTKHICVRANGDRTTASELGQFSPIFIWLLRVTGSLSLRNPFFKNFLSKLTEVFFAHSNETHFVRISI
jgi:hypothetical protein